MLALALPCLSSAGEHATFLPFMGPRLEAARYAPANSEFAWVGWIGATADLVEGAKWSVYLTPDVETILGHRVRSFEAVQANYSIELGARREVASGRLSVFLHHVSRHIQDRFKAPAVAWNFLGVRYESAWPQRWGRRGAYSGSLAVATLSSGVEYKWEARLSADVDVMGHGRQRSPYLLADIRHVRAEATQYYPRGPFTDLRVEIGFRRWQDSSQFALFVAYQHRNDALIPSPLKTDRALFGFRIRGHGRVAPSAPPLP